MLVQLYLAFLRIGGLTFGGGLTMLPMLKYELVRDGKIVAGEKIVLAGFGAGLTYGACVMEY